MLKRLQQLAAEGADFAFETTLASRSFAPWIKELINKGYLFHLVFLWSPNPEFCINRVKERVSMGGA
jgi:predicted ABC-type ATPase